MRWPQFFIRLILFLKRGEKKNFFSSQKCKRGHFQHTGPRPSEMTASTHGYEEVNLDWRVLSSLRIFVLWGHWRESLLASLKGGERASKCATKPLCFTHFTNYPGCIGASVRGTLK